MRLILILFFSFYSFISQARDFNSHNNESQRSVKAKLFSLVYKNKLKELEEIFIYGNKEKRKVYKKYINSKNSKGITPVFNAIKNNNFEIVNLLIDHGADLNIQDEEGYTPAFYAVQNSGLKILEFLIEHGVDLNVQDKQSNTLICHIAEMKRNAFNIVSSIRINESIFHFLVDNGASTDTLCYDLEITPLHGALLTKSKDLIDKVIDSTTFFDKSDSRFFLLPIHIAAWQGLDYAIDSICEKAPETINTQDSWGWTPLHYAFWKQNNEAVESLLKCGADLNIKNDRGQTAQDTVHGEIKAKYRHFIEKILEQY